MIHQLQRVHYKCNLINGNVINIKSKSPIKSPAKSTLGKLRKMANDEINYIMMIMMKMKVNQLNFYL